MSVNVAKGSSVAITLASFWPRALNTTKYPKTSSTRVLNTGLFSASCGKKDQGWTINWHERSLAWKTLSKCAEPVEHPQYFENWMNEKGAYLKRINKLRSSTHIIKSNRFHWFAFWLIPVTVKHVIPTSFGPLCFGHMNLIVHTLIINVKALHNNGGNFRRFLWFYILQFYF